MVDNFEQIGNLLSFESDDEFYFLQVLYFPFCDFLT